jgi:hypothetical protein
VVVVVVMMAWTVRCLLCPRWLRWRSLTRLPGALTGLRTPGNDSRRRCALPLARSFALYPVPTHHLPGRAVTLCAWFGW